MPQIAPVSDLKNSIDSAAAVTDSGQVAILTQNGYLRWATVGYDE